MVVAVWLVRPGLRHLQLLGYLAGAVAVVSLLVGVALPDQGVFHAPDGTLAATDKAVLPFGVLVGVFTHGNTLGQHLVLGLPLVALVPRRGVRAALLAASAVALLWSAARSTIAGAVALAVVVSVLSLLPAVRRPVVHRLVLWAAFAVVAALPFLTTGPDAFTGRGAIWTRSLAYWREHLWVGQGTDFYARVAETTADLGGTVYHGHNEVVQLLVTGGVVLAVLVAVLVLAAVARAADAPYGSLTGVAVLLALATASLLEVSLLFDSGGVFYPVLLLPLATLLVGEPLGAEPDGPAAGARTQQAGSSHAPVVDLGRAAARGTAVTLGAQGGRFALQIGSLVVLARLLTPEAFGLVAMATSVLGVAELVRDFGLSSAAVQAKHLSDDERTNLFWVNVAIGTACAAPGPRRRSAGRAAVRGPAGRRGGAGPRRPARRLGRDDAVPGRAQPEPALRGARGGRAVRPGGRRRRGHHERGAGRRLLGGRGPAGHPRARHLRALRRLLPLAPGTAAPPYVGAAVRAVREPRAGHPGARLRHEQRRQRGDRRGLGRRPARRLQPGLPAADGADQPDQRPDEPGGAAGAVAGAGRPADAAALRGEGAAGRARTASVRCSRSRPGWPPRWSPCCSARSGRRSCRSSWSWPWGACSAASGWSPTGGSSPGGVPTGSCGCTW